jgi:error-prone DNA polymerase
MEFDGWSIDTKVSASLRLRGETPVSDYIELHSHSAFSFLAGASLPEDLVARAAELNYSVLALGDRDGLYGAPRFHQAARRAGLRAIVGAELTLGGEKGGV